MAQNEKSTVEAAVARRFVTKQQLMAQTGLSGATIERYKKKRKIPFYQPGGRGARVMFPRDAIEAAVRQSTPEPHAAAATSSPVHQAGVQTGETLGSPKLSGPRPRWQTSRPGAQE